MIRHRLFSHLCVSAFICGFISFSSRAHQIVEFPADVLEDKIRGGMLGQILGNLNGLPHEMKYISNPGSVQTYTPSLPNGARTDDDTDIEWVYILEMQRSKKTLIPDARIVELWKSHMNQGIWCSNLYARHLFDLGIDPPLTGELPINPWANFNISGSFLAETWGLVAPAMPQTAATIGLHYTHVAISHEPAQSTQFVTAMVSTAFVEKDIEKILDAGLAAVDPKSVIHPITAHVRALVKENPTDWRATRKAIHDKYTRFDGEMADRNGVELNTAATIAALLYGKGDFIATMVHAFNFGWDADNNAATCGTILGVIHGKKWMDQQGWTIKDTYRNTTRPGLPIDETITSFSTRVVEVAHRVIRENLGSTRFKDGQTHYRIRSQAPQVIRPLLDPAARLIDLRKELFSSIESDLAKEGIPAARAAYLAIALDEAPRLQKEKAGEWAWDPLESTCRHASLSIL